MVADNSIKRDTISDLKSVMSSPEAMDDIIERNRRFEEYLERKSR